MRRIRFIVPILLFGFAAAGCHDPLSDRTGAGPDLAFTLSVAGGPAEAFDRVDRIRVQVRAAATLIADSVLSFASGGSDVRLRIRLPRGYEDAAVNIDVELRSGAEPLFTGSGTAVVARGAPVEIPLLPVAARIEPPATQPVIRALGSTTTLEVAAVFATGDTIPDVAFTWIALDPSIVSVTAEGVAHGETEGVGRVEVRLGSISTVVPVNVRPDVAGVVVTPARAVILPGGQATFAFAAVDATGVLLRNRRAVWSSSSTAVAVIDSTGLARGVAVGTATIEANVEGVTGTAQIEVTLTLPPAAPSSLSAQPVDSTVTLTWVDNATDEQSYEVHRGPLGGTRTRIATLPANSTTYADATGGDQVLRYTVLACNAGGCAESEVVTTRTLPRPPASLTLTVTDSARFEFRLNWQDASAAETRFEIQVFDNAAGEWVKRADVTAGTTSWDGTGSAGTTDQFRVLACNEAGCSAPSDIVSVTFLLAPPFVTTLASMTPLTTRGSVDGHGSPYTAWFEWSEDPAFVDPNIVPFPEHQDSVVKTFEDPILELTAGTVHYYRMVAENAAGRSTGSAQSFTTPDLRHISISGDSVCNNVNPPCSVPDSIVIVAQSIVPAGTADPFAGGVVFYLDFDHDNPLGTATVTSSTSGGNTTYTYTMVFAPGPTVAARSYFLVVAGYPAANGGSVLALIQTIFVVDQ